jgi:hypothetical protein
MKPPTDTSSMQARIEELRERRDAAMLGGGALADIPESDGQAKACPTGGACFSLPSEQTQESISAEELLAISAALSAYFGVRVHVRQARPIGSRAWAREGRVSIQASHRLH